MYVLVLAYLIPIQLPLDKVCDAVLFCQSPRLLERTWHTAAGQRVAGWLRRER